MKKVIKIANGQGFWGDSIDAPIDLINNADINYLTLDYPSSHITVCRSPDE